MDLSRFEKIAEHFVKEREFIANKSCAQTFPSNGKIIVAGVSVILILNMLHLRQIISAYFTA